MQQTTKTFRRPSWRLAAIAIAVLLASALGVRLASIALVVHEGSAVAVPDAPITAARLASSLGPRRSAGRFAVLGDPEEGRSVFRRCLARAKAEGCEFVVVTGDLVDNATPLAYRLFLRDVRGAGYGDRFAVVRGEDDDAWVFRRFFGSSDWSIALGDTLLLGVDNATALLDDNQLRFAAKAFDARPPGGAALLFSHRPVFPYQTKDELADDSESEWREVLEGIDNGTADPRFAALMVERKLDYALASHLHAYERNVFSGVCQVVSGGGGGGLQREGVGYNFLVVDADGARCDVRRVDVESSASALGWVEELGLSLYGEFDRRPWREVPEDVALLLLAVGSGWLGRARRRDDRTVAAANATIA